MKKRGETFLPVPFYLAPSTEEWLELKYPQVDVKETVNKFCDEAAAKGWMYRDWQAGFRTVIRNGMEKGWRSIVTIKGGREFDPKWTAILAEARAEAFREPHEVETPQAYRTALHLWRMSPRKNVVDFSQVLKRVAK